MMRARVKRNVWRLPHSPFASGPPWVASRAAVARALTWLVAMTTTTHLEHVRPLRVSQSVCVMDRWMSRLISRGYTLQFASPPQSHADDQTGAGMCSPGRLVHFHLKDAYFHVPIIPKHRKFLRFCVPWLLAFCVEKAGATTQRRDESEVFSLDDLLARSREEVALQTLHLVSHLSKPGFHNEFGEELPSLLSDIHLSGSGIKLSQQSAALAAASGGTAALSSSRNSGNSCVYLFSEISDQTIVCRSDVPWLLAFFG